MASRWYRKGAVSVESGSKEVIGVKTYWVDDTIKPLSGDIMLIADGFYEIESIIDNNTITLYEPFTGNPPRNGEYAIIRHSSLNLTTRVAAMVAQLVNGKQSLFDQVNDFYTSKADKIQFDIGDGMTTDVTPIQTLEANLTKLVEGIEPATGNEIKDIAVKQVQADEPATAVWDRNSGLLTFSIPQGKQGYSNNKINNLESGLETINVDVSQGSVFPLKLMQPTTTMNINVSNPDPSAAIQCILVLEQGTGSNKVIWPDNIKWPTSSNPHLSYEQGKKDTVALMSLDQGATWMAFLSGSGF
ncbi:TPA: hypothetical protein KDY90_002581 [Vibrio parahaemolyticus]|nr:hypothetical protein [Vibrio parahaemolyticus]